MPNPRLSSALDARLGPFRALVHEVEPGTFVGRLRQLRALLSRRPNLGSGELRALNADLHALCVALAWVVPLVRSRYRASTAHGDVQVRLEDGIVEGAWIESYLDELPRHTAKGRSFAAFVLVRLIVAIRAELRTKHRRLEKVRELLPVHEGPVVELEEELVVGQALGGRATNPEEEQTLRIDLLQALDALPGDGRDVVVALAMGHTQREVAIRKGVSPAAVNQQLGIVRERLDRLVRPD